MVNDGEPIPGQQPSIPEAPQSNVSSDVLDFVGISAEDVAKFDLERITREKLLVESEHAGRNDYLRRGVNGWGFAKHGTILISVRNLSEVPDALVAKTDQLKSGTKLEDWRRYEEERKHYLMGIGSGALEEGDWQTAVNAFDVAAEGGILQNQTAQEKIKDLAQADKMAGAEIARAIQKRMQERQAGEVEHQGLQATSMMPQNVGNRPSGLDASLPASEPGPFQR